MKLLCIVLNAPERLEEVLEGLLEAGVTGGTVVGSEGMGHLIEDVPLFAGMRNLFRTAKPHNNMIFSVVSDAQAVEALGVLATIIGGGPSRAAGIAFTMPIDAAIGLPAGG